jgi:RNA polymerase sigma-70 factor (ECF subfamily)
MIFLVLNTDEDVFLIEAIYHKYSKFMFKVAYGILHNNYDAEDAVQQTILRIIDNLDKIGDLEDKRTRNFIGVICRNVAINIYNKSKRVVMLDDDIEEETGDIALIVINKETCERVEDFIYSLDGIYRDVILLKVQNYSIKEIAEILDISPKTVQKRLERGRVRIKKFLAEEVEKYDGHL